MAPDDDDDFEDEDEPVQVVVASGVGEGGGVDELSGLLLEMSAATTKLGVLLRETDEDEFKAIKKRLKVFTGLVADLPESAPPKRRVGFQVPKKRKPKRRKS